ncbi:hypothetical protein SRHO_G00267950 [Serrasalmus rhombeus]
MGASSSTQVYNASPYEIEVLFPVGKLKKKIVQLDPKSEDDASATEEIRKTPSKNYVIEVLEEERNCSVKLPPGDEGSIKGCGRLLISVQYKLDSNSNHDVCTNYPVPKNRSIIVTERTVKFQGINSAPWVDESDSPSPYPELRVPHCGVKHFSRSGRGSPAARKDLPQHATPPHADTAPQTRTRYSSSIRSSRSVYGCLSKYLVCSDCRSAALQNFPRFSWIHTQPDSTAADPPLSKTSPASFSPLVIMSSKDKNKEERIPEPVSEQPRSSSPCPACDCSCDGADQVCSHSCESSNAEFKGCWSFRTLNWLLGWSLAPVSDEVSGIAPAGRRMTILHDKFVPSY